MERVKGTEQTLYEGGGHLTPSSIIANWSGELLYSVRVRAPGDDDEMAKALPSLQLPIVHKEGGSTLLLRFTNKADAEKAIKLYVGVLDNPIQVWHFRCAKSSVLNIDQSSLEKWSDPIIIEVENSGLGSTRGRHRFHFIASVLGVRAFADWFKRHPSDSSDPSAWANITLPEVSFNDLVVVEKKDDEGSVVDQFSDELFAKLCGSPDSKSVDWKAKFPLQRAALWLALGEKDPSKSRTSDSKPLHDCLTSIATKWNGWARVVQLSDPGMDKNAFDGNGKRKRISAVEHFFESESDAREAATKELAERAARRAKKAGGNGALPTEQSGPQVPSVWASKPQDIADWKRYVVEMKDKPLPACATELGVTVGDVVAWRAHLGV